MKLRHADRPFRRLGFALAVGVAVTLGVGAAAAQQSWPNRELIGTNLAGIADWSPQYPFANLMKQSRPLQNSPGDYYQPVNERGYPRVVPDEASPYYTVVLSEFHPPGRYVLEWDGEAELTMPRYDVTDVPVRQPNRLEAVVQPQRGLYVNVERASRDKPVKDIRLWLPGLEGHPTPFNPAFLDYVRPFGTLRFMDWMHTNNSGQESWSYRPTPDQVNFRLPGRVGVPVEWMVELANILDADPWFCMPHKANDEYVRRFAAYVRDHLEPGLKAYVEYSNEVWNWNFQQSRYALQRGQEELGLEEGQAPHRAFYAKRSVEIFRIWEEVFGGTDRLVRVIAAQAANTRIAEKTMEYGDCAKHTDAIAIAPYFGFNRELMREKVQGLESVDAVLDVAERVIETKVATMVSEHKALAERYGVELIAYEAGQHLLARQERRRPEGGPMTDLFIAANRHPRMAKLYRKYLETWFDNGGGVIAMFSSIARPSRYGSWGMSEYLGQPLEEAHKYRAVLEAVRDPELIDQP